MRHWRWRVAFSLLGAMPLVSGCGNGVKGVRWREGLHRNGFPPVELYGQSPGTVVATFDGAAVGGGTGTVSAVDGLAALRNSGSTGSGSSASATVNSSTDHIMLEFDIGGTIFRKKVTKSMAGL